MENVIYSGFDQDKYREEKRRRDAEYAALSDFGKFWFNCPKKVDKALTERKFERITGEGLDTRTFDRDSNGYECMSHRAAPAELIEGMRRYAAVCAEEQTERRYIMHPATSLNKGRWRDYE